MAHWHRLSVAVSITALVGCGNPTPDHPTLGHTAGSTDAVVSSPGGDAASSGLVANEPARQAPTQMSPLGLIAQHASTPDASITDASRTISPGHHDVHAQTAAFPVDEPTSHEHADAKRAQREARRMWFAEAREHPDVTVRLQALEHWVLQPGDALDPVTYALVDGDEDVRARAQQLWEQQLTRDMATTVSVKEEGPGGQAE